MFNILQHIIYAPFAGLWLDEAFSILMAKESLNEITKITLTDFNPPLYYYALHYWIKLAGDSPFICRIPSLLAYTIFIYLIYKSLRILGIKRSSLLGHMLLVATIPSILYFALEIRMYIFQAFLVLLSLLLLHKKSRYLIPINSMLLYLHTASIFYVLGIYLYILYLLKTNFKLARKLFIYNSLSLLSYAPWIFFFIKFHSQLKLTNPWAISYPSLLNLFKLPNNLYGGISYIPEITIPLILLTISGFFYTSIIIYSRKDYLSIKTNNHNDFYILLFINFIGSIAAAAIVGAYSGTFYWRYLWFNIGPFVLILVYNLDRSIRNLYIKSTIIAIVIIFNLTYFGEVGSWQKIKVPENLRHLKDNEILITDRIENIFPLKYYFGGNKVKIIGVKDFDEVSSWYGKALMKETDFIFSDYQIDKNLILLIYDNDMQKLQTFDKPSLSSPIVN